MHAPVNTITTKDRIQIYFQDWGTGPVVVLSHGWPLHSGSWEIQAQYLASHGFRVITHDRRGHGRSSASWAGNEMDSFADDLSAVIEALNLDHVSMIGFSMGGGEVARYIGRHGTKRLSRVSLVAAVPPLMLKTAANPGGLPIDIFDGIRATVTADRSQAYKDISGPFFGANREGSKATQGMRDAFWLQGMQSDFKTSLDCIQAFSETDFTEDLKKFDLPTLIIHGDEDQIVPIGAAGIASAKIIEHARLEVYKGAPHGLANTHSSRLNADLLSFLRD